MHRPNSDNGALDLEAIAQRIRQMLSELGLSGMDFSNESGVAYSTLRTYMGAGSNRRPPSPEFLAAAYRRFGVMPSWLLTGEGPMRSELPAGEPSTLSSEFVVVPVYAARAAAGAGAVNGDESEHASGGLCFSRSWLAKRSLSPQNLGVIHIHGNSMEPKLFNGDPALIDQADTQPRSGFVYVIRQGDELLAKYCQVLPGGVLRVSSENPVYPPYDVDLGKTPDVTIIGRVVASMHEW